MLNIRSPNPAATHDMHPTKLIIIVSSLWLPESLICKTFILHKENQMPAVLPVVIDAIPLPCSIWGWFHWLLLVVNEDSRGVGGVCVCLFVFQLSHTGLNMTLGQLKVWCLCVCSVADMTTGLNDRLKLLTEPGIRGRGYIVCECVFKKRERERARKKLTDNKQWNIGILTNCQCCICCHPTHVVEEELTINNCFFFLLATMLRQELN